MNLVFWCISSFWQKMKYPVIMSSSCSISGKHLDYSQLSSESKYLLTFVSENRVSVSRLDFL